MRPAHNFTFEGWIATHRGMESFVMHRTGFFPRPVLLVPVLLLVVTWILLAGCGPVVHVATQEPRPLTDVGQIQFETPFRGDRGIVVPLTYVGGAWHVNSAHVPVEVKSTIEDSEIRLTIVTAVHTKRARKNQGRELVLPLDAGGEYKVFYLDPDGTRHEIADAEIYS